MPVWGIPCLFIYYILIHRMKIVVTDGGELVYKPSNSLFCETIDIQKIDSASLERGLLLTRAVIRYNGKERAFLYPQDVPAFWNCCNPFVRGAVIRNPYKNKTHSGMLNLRLTHESGEKREPTTRGSLPDNSFFICSLPGWATMMTND